MAFKVWAEYGARLLMSWSLLNNDFYLAQEYIKQMSIPEPNTGCWIWVGSMKSDGYGNNTRRFFGKRFKNAHRLSICAFNKINPQLLSKNHFSCHKCHNKFCVNPGHLYLGDAKQNVKDEIDRNNNKNKSKKFCSKGHPLDAENVYASVDKNGHNKRTCKKCRNHYSWEAKKRSQYEKRKWAKKIAAGLEC